MERIFFSKFFFASFQIGFDFFYREIGQIHGADFASFSANAEFTRIEINGVFIECGQFRYTQTGGINTFDNRGIAFSLNRFCVDFIENPHDFFGIEKCHFAIFLFDEIDRNRIDGFVSLFSTKLQKSPKSDHIRIRCLHG